MKDCELLFVYGTLRRGSRHAMGRWLAERAEWRGEAWCEGRLYRVGWYPALVPPGPEGGRQVRGDLYLLRDASTLWPALDDFEGVTGRAGDEYERRRSLVREKGGAGASAWIYWYRRPVAGLAEIESGDWLLA